ncbi:hypothetical protein [Paenisporosarcina cavernae]|uniref:Uncharacterized protein n=1 Tax=Paenisporosarcina cavernae TaxID=2320858 RepID=A0A385YSG8_9BACL|nr:hypothetical protein [Paenisporosarcina cavernae]AYC29749.1 hypothetical protein D3873_07525 [Paenisporosarcina cavernae]
MPIKKKSHANTTILALLHGFLVGCVTIGLFALLLNWSSIRGETEKQPEALEEIPVQVELPPDGAVGEVTLFANQLGAFSSIEGAKSVSTSDAAIPPAIFPISDKYYVWDTVDLEEGKIVKGPQSFVKKITVSTASCDQEGLKRLASLLSETDTAKFYFQDSTETVNLPPDWKELTASLSTLTTDLGIQKAQLLSHYVSKNSCVKISF